ncbi:MAG: phytoene desaturase [Bacteroidales bacterium]|nr:phytoene desaturase [Bacteroidales bacterium]
MNKKTVNIIGSGFAGLSAAATIASMGYDVKVFEKNSMPGGRARKLEENGYRFDMGPTWYWMPDVFEKFFNRFGYKVSDLYELKRVSPGYRMFFGEDDYLDVPANMDELYATFESIEKGSAARLKTFLDKAEYKYDIGVNKIVYLPGNSPLELVRWDFIKGLFKFDFFRSVTSYVHSEFKDPRLRQILEFPVIFLGAPPQKTPALYTLMNYADLKLGTWYPVGGMYSVVEAMKKVAEEQGAEFYLDSPVEKILMNNSKAKALVVNGKEYPADTIVGAGDYHHIEYQLLPEEFRQYSEKYWDKRVMAPSSLLFYLGVNKKLKGLLHHNLFFDEDFIRHAAEIYEKPQWPTNPAIYVSCNASTDPSVAPEGHDNLIILIPVAPGLEDSESTREFYYDLIIKRLEKITKQKIGENVVYKKSYAHNDFINDYHSYKGNAYGLANTLLQTAFLKPKMKSNKVSNLFYTGQLTVPGPGVPPTIISGQVVASEIDKYFRKKS